jgi:hypothetical protein
MLRPHRKTDFINSTNTIQRDKSLKDFVMGGTPKRPKQTQEEFKRKGD